MPDLNSLPSSPAPSPLHIRTTMTSDTSSTSSPARGIHTPPSPSQQPQSPTSAATHSLAAAAALNAGLATEAREASRRSSGNCNIPHPPSAERRRSSIRMNLHINDPALPGPGELAMSPGGRRASHSYNGLPVSPGGHRRAPSLGELHQELENEQEAQVNRLLSMIRQQQAQIQAMESRNQATPTAASSSAITIDDGTPMSEGAMSLNASQQNIAQPTQPTAPRPRSPFHPPQSLSRHSSYRSGYSSHEGSPAIRPVSTNYGSHNESSEFLLGAPAASRDDSAFYQAETQMLTRENQMLKHRIRELERELNNMNPASPITHSPVMASALHRTPISVQEAESSTAQASADPDAMDTSKD